ncbi:hypothetical protein BDZ97DRAFT_1928696 [Flammula alnicola]|nr:hypothetical protein BDZ97DRAFT_1928696 [Flammula alnicola]
MGRFCVILALITPSNVDYIYFFDPCSRKPILPAATSGSSFQASPSPVLFFLLQGSPALLSPFYISPFVVTVIALRHVDPTHTAGSPAAHLPSRTPPVLNTRPQRPRRTYPTPASYPAPKISASPPSEQAHACMHDHQTVPVELDFLAPIAHRPSPIAIELPFAYVLEHTPIEEEDFLPSFATHPSGINANDPSAEIPPSSITVSLLPLVRLIYPFSNMTSHKMKVQRDYSDYEMGERIFRASFGVLPLTDTLAQYCRRCRQWFKFEQQLFTNAPLTVFYSAAFCRYDVANADARAPL